MYVFFRLSLAGVLFRSITNKFSYYLFFDSCCQSEKNPSFVSCACIKNQIQAIPKKFWYFKYCVFLLPLVLEKVNRGGFLLQEVDRKEKIAERPNL